MLRLARWLSLVLLCLCGAGVVALEPGQAAPALDLPGEPARVTLPDPEGRVVYLDFWASWCGPCRQSFPWMNAMQQKYAGAGLRVVAVNLDAEDDERKAFLARIPAQFAIGLDPEGTSARDFGVKGMPTSVLIGRDGKVLLRHDGFNSRDTTALEQAIRAALGVQP